MESIVIYLVAGLITGLVSGLFGVGGGLTVVPALVLALPYEGVGTQHVMHMAIATSLAVMIFTATVTTVWRHRRGDLDWGLLWRFGWLVAVGGAIGAVAGDSVDGTVLRIFFVAFVAYTILREAQRLWLPARGKPAQGHNPAQREGRGNDLPFVAHGLATGVVGALLGVGAAVIATPFLMRRGYSIQRASAVAAGLSAVIGCAAGAGYVFGGLDEAGLPPLAIGYLYLPAFLGIAAGALVGSPIGVALSHAFPERRQRIVFVVYLSLVFAVMVARL